MASFVNSTVSILTANSVYTGTATPALAGSTQYFNVAVYSDQASATGGLVIQGSLDNTNWYPLATASTAAATPTILSVPMLTPYTRVVFTNGGTNQAQFLLVSGITE